MNERCPMCGEWMDWDKVLRVDVCTSCDQVRATHPTIMEWVQKVAAYAAKCAVDEFKKDLRRNL